MSTASVYDAYRIKPGGQRQVKGFTQQAMVQQYRAELRRTATSLGYPNAPVTVSDPAALATLEAEAEQTAARVRRVYNAKLRTALDALPAGLTDAERRAGLEPFFQGVHVYNTSTMIPYIADRAAAMAREDFFTRNAAIQTSWEVQGAATCARCGQAKAGDRSVFLPAHPHCGDVWVPSVDLASLPATPWIGRDPVEQTTDQQEAEKTDHRLAILRRQGGWVQMDVSRCLAPILREYGLVTAGLVGKYSPSQPRGEHGRWTSSGGHGGSSAGRSSGGARLTMAGGQKIGLEQARAIREAHHINGVSKSVLAKQYGVSSTLIGNITAYRLHKESFKPGEKITIHHARQLRAMATAGATKEELMKHSGLSEKAVRQILKHNTHKEPGGSSPHPTPAPKPKPGGTVKPKPEPAPAGSTQKPGGAMKERTHNFDETNAWIAARHIVDQGHLAEAKRADDGHYFVRVHLMNPGTQRYELHGDLHTADHPLLKKASFTFEARTAKGLSSLHEMVGHGLQHYTEAERIKAADAAITRIEGEFHAAHQAMHGGQPIYVPRGAPGRAEYDRKMAEWEATSKAANARFTWMKGMDPTDSKGGRLMRTAMLVTAAAHPKAPHDEEYAGTSLFGRFKGSYGRPIPVTDSVPGDGHWSSKPDAHGYASAGHVTMLATLGSDQYALVLAHEIGHVYEPMDSVSTGYHSSNLKRGQSEARVETQAMLIAELFGLGSKQRDSSIGYVLGWSSRMAYKGFTPKDRAYIRAMILRTMETVAAQ